MGKLKFQIFLTVALSFVISTLPAQNLSTIVVNQIDSLFNEFNAPNTPGCAIGVVRNDSLIYAKGYGSANLEYDIPITSKTIFYMASVSKQFTAYSVVLLAKAGKLSLDDDIRNHLSWLPDMEKKITIRHLLNHTSGLRDDLEMAAYGGLGDGSYVSQELAIQYIKNSKALNFKPGEKYLYSNSNYVLLAEIVKERSGQSFRTFTDSALFRPLGMKNSFFLDYPNEVIKNRAVSYFRTRNQHRNVTHNVFTLGDGGMFSNIEDLSKWAMNFYKPIVGSAEDILQLAQNGLLNDGSKISYALGIAANEYKGLKQFTHSGALGGYRTNITIFPEIKMAFIILGNLGSINSPAKSNQLADIFLKNYASYNPSTSAPKVPMNYAAADTHMVRSLSGDYISDDGVQFKFQFNGQNLLWVTRTGFRRLVQTARETFEDSVQVKFQFSSPGKKTTARQSFPGYYRILTKYLPDSTFIVNRGQMYTGSYYSPELESRLEIVFKDGKLILKSPKAGDLTLKILDPGNMLIENFGTHLKFFTTEKKVVTAFEMNTSRMMNVRFDKIK